MKSAENDIYDVKLETMSAEERERYTCERLKYIIQYAYQNAPAIKEKMDRAGVSPAQIRRIKDLEAIPITRKEELAELQKANLPFGGFLAVPLESLEKIFISPGPIYEPPDPEETTKVSCKAFYAAGFRKGDRVMVTWNYNMVPPGPRTDLSLKQLGATAIPTGIGNTELQLQIMRDLKVNGYIATPTFLMILVKKAEELGYDFHQDFYLDHAWVAGGIVTRSYRETMEQDYGISITQGYGTAEVPIIGYECNRKSGLHIPEEAIAEIVDPKTGKQLEPGEVGEVVVTSYSKYYPLIRLGTGDLSSIITEPCSCGRTSNRLTGILGRVGDEVKVRGMFIHPLQIQEVIAKFDNISNFQVVVSHDEEKREKIVINLELERSDSDDRQRITDSLPSIFQGICRLRLDKVNFVAKGTIPEQRKMILDHRTWE